jgi:hypothetical protein
MNWVFISYKTTFFIVAAVKSSNLTDIHIYEFHKIFSIPQITVNLL